MHQLLLAWSLVAACAVKSQAVPALEVTRLLTRHTFGDAIRSNGLVLVNFFEPSCSHCEKLAPEYGKAASSLRDNNNITLVKVDCIAERDLCNEQNVHSYPTLKVFKGGSNTSLYEFSGDRTADAIHSYMMKQTLPAVPVLTNSTLQELKTSSKLLVVGYIAADDETNSTIFEAVAEEHRNTYIFGGVADAEIAWHEATSIPSIVVYKNFDEGKNIFTGKFEAGAIARWIETAAIPLIGELGPESSAKYLKSGLPLGLIFAETPAERAELADVLRPTAERYRGKINLLTVDAVEYGFYTPILNLEPDKFPAFAVEEIGKNRKFPFDQDKEITGGAVDEFLWNWVEGRIDPSVWSAPNPDDEDNPEDSIKETRKAKEEL